MNHFNNPNWISVSNAETPDAIAELVDKGVVSQKGFRHRKNSPPTPQSQKTPSQTASQTAISPTRPIYVNTAYDASQFLQTFPEITFVYHEKTWWKYDHSQGWKQVSSQDMEFYVAPYIRQRGEKLTQKTAADMVFALNTFCNLSASKQLFEPSYFLETLPDGGLSARHAPGWIACQSHLFHVPTVARKLVRGEPIPEEFLRPLQSNLFTPGRIPCNLQLTAKCPQWEEFVHAACPEDVQTLHEMFGLSMTYDRSFNTFFVIYGKAGTGKSTCLNILQKLHQGTVSQVSLGRFGERFFIYPLSQNRVNIVHDMDSIYEGDGSVSLREAVLKSVSAGESLEVERKHRHAQQEWLRALCVFGTNNIPRFADKSEAIAQRMRIITFPTVFRGQKKQVRNFHEILLEELEGILIWALKGYGELLESGKNLLHESLYATILKDAAIKDSRPEILFCDDCLEREPSCQIPTTSLYQSYANYCFSRGYKPAGMSKVIPMITDYMGVDKPRQIRFGGRKYRSITGIRILGGIPEEENRNIF